MFEIVSSSKKQHCLAKSLTVLANEPIVDGKTSPSQVGHLLPSLIYDRIAVISAYDERLAEVDNIILQKLNVELKRLLLTVSAFEDVLGKQITALSKEVQSLQSTLDQINNITMAQSNLDQLMNTGKKKYVAVFESYSHTAKPERQSWLLNSRGNSHVSIVGKYNRNYRRYF